MANLEKFSDKKFDVQILIIVQLTEFKSSQETMNVFIDESSIKLIKLLARSSFSPGRDH